MSTHKKIRDAIEHIMDGTQEPMLKASENENYAVWRKTGESRRFASGMPYMLIESFSFEARLLESADVEKIALDLKDAFKRAGIRSTGGSVSYDPQILRRKLHFHLTIRNGLV